MAERVGAVRGAGDLRVQHHPDDEPLMLTKRQKEVLEFIYDFQISTGGVSPSFADVAQRMETRSRGQAAQIIRQLEERGFIRRLHNRARAIEVVKLRTALPEQWRVFRFDPLMKMLRDDSGMLVGKVPT